MWQLRRILGGSLLAILIGNIIYFLLMPRLPVWAQHQAYQLDPGLLLDFGICAAVYAGLQRVWRVQR